MAPSPYPPLPHGAATAYTPGHYGVQPALPTHPYGPRKTMRGLKEYRFDSRGNLWTKVPPVEPYSK
jgi:hypothetical protein